MVENDFMVLNKIVIMVHVKLAEVMIEEHKIPIFLLNKLPLHGITIL